MAVTGFNIGKDASIDLVHPDQGVIPIALMTSFNPRPLKTRLKSAPITNGGRNVYRVTYQGWEGTVELDRTDGVVDILTNLLETNYFAGLPETYFMITETVRNPDGSVDQFRYTNVVFEPEDMGTFRGEEKVSQRFMFVASQRLKV